MRKRIVKRKNPVGTESSFAASVGTSIDVDSTKTFSKRTGYIIKNVKKELPVKLHRAVWKSNEEKVARLVDKKDRKGQHKHSLIMVDECRRTALHLAACQQSLRIVSLLLTREGPEAMKMQDFEGNTPLHKAVECDNYMVILMFEKLQLCRLTANVKNNMGHTPLHLSAINNDVDGAEKILDAGAVVDSYDAYGNTPLALAVIHSSLEFIDFLKKADATADSTNIHGETPLILAVRMVKIDIVKKLLSFRMINPKLKDNSNKSAIDYAESLKSTEIIQELNKVRCSIPTRGIVVESILPSPCYPQRVIVSTSEEHLNDSIVPSNDKGEGCSDDVFVMDSDCDFASTPIKSKPSTMHMNFNEMFKMASISSYYDLAEVKQEFPEDEDKDYMEIPTLPPPTIPLVAGLTYYEKVIVPDEPAMHDEGKEPVIAEENPPIIEAKKVKYVTEEFDSEGDDEDSIGRKCSSDSFFSAVSHFSGTLTPSKPVIIEEHLSESDKVIGEVICEKQQILEDLLMERDIEIKTIKQQKDEEMDAKVQEKHALELKVQELEMKQDSLLASKSDLLEELKEMKVSLKAEQERTAAIGDELIEKEKSNALIVENLKCDIRRIESDNSAKSEQILALKRKIASMKTSKILMEKDIQSLKKELGHAMETNAHLEETMCYSAIDEAYETLDREKDQLSVNTDEMEQEAAIIEKNFDETKEPTRKYKEVKLTADEKDKAIYARLGLETQLCEFEDRMNGIFSELSQYELREKELLTEIDKLNKSNAGLKESASKVSSEKFLLEQELADERTKRERYELANMELKGICESEMKAKQELADRIHELEANGSVSEKNKKKMKMQKRIKIAEAHRLDNMNPSGAAEPSEIITLYQKISKLQEDLEDEEKEKVAAADKAHLLELELKISQKLLEDAKQELIEVSERQREENKEIIHLTDELNRVQDHLSQLTLPRETYEAVSAEHSRTHFQNERNIMDSKGIQDKEVSKRGRLAFIFSRKRRCRSKPNLKMERLETKKMLEDDQRKYDPKLSRITSLRSSLEEPSNNEEDTTS